MPDIFGQQCSNVELKVVWPGLACWFGPGRTQRLEYREQSHMYDNTYLGSKSLSGLVLLAVVISLCAVSCKQSEQKFDSSQALAEYQDQQMNRWSKDALVDNATFQTPTAQQTVAFPVGPTTGGQRFTVQDVQDFLPDPLDAGISDTVRPSQVKLSLQDCIRRALENSLAFASMGITRRSVPPMYWLPRRDSMRFISSSHSTIR